MSTERKNIFLSGSLGRLYLITAAPIIFVFLVNGFYTLVDAYFLGKYVGADALTAVTLMFPFFMMLVAFSAWVSGGFSSLFARLLGAGQQAEAGQAYVGASLLSIFVAFVLMAVFALIGGPLSTWISNGHPELASMGYTYMSILIFTSPLMFVLSVNIDALRCEGKMPQMAMVTLLGSALNILYNYILIVQLDWGVAGSAWGTVFAQASSMVAIIILRRLQGTSFPLFWDGWKHATRHWMEFLSLGITPSLGNFGVSLIATAALFSLQKFSTTYDVTAGAYGIITRINTFTFLPLLGIGIGMQTIVGNNYGAKLYDRSNSGFKIAIGIALVYNITTQVLLLTFRHKIGFLFVDDAAIAAEVARIIPITMALMFLFGFNMMWGMYFTAIGDPVRAAILGLSRTYAFAVPGILILPQFIGEIGIWVAQPVSEILLLITVIVVLTQRWRKTGYRFGIFQ